MPLFGAGAKPTSTTGDPDKTASTPAFNLFNSKSPTSGNKETTSSTPATVGETPNLFAAFGSSTAKASGSAQDKDKDKEKNPVTQTKETSAQGR